jgi:hypothetical protein
MTDSFLQSMTFSRAEQFLNACDCEECENIPPSIRKFIEERKHERMVTGPIKRTQQRTLVGRHGQISLWNMHMPKNAEPLIEFGSSHRIVWVKQLATSLDARGKNNGSSLRWIGKGIIGSSDEEKSRKKMIEWTEGNVFLVPSNGGKAVGWIYASDDSNSTNTNTATNDDDATGTTKNKDEKRSEDHGFAVLYVAKIPLGIIDKEQQQESRESSHQWTNQLAECCRNGLESRGKESNETPLYYKLSAEASKGVAAESDVAERPSKRICLNPQVVDTSSSA